jgi:hypothetical protein
MRRGSMRYRKRRDNGSPWPTQNYLVRVIDTGSRVRWTFNSLAMVAGLGLFSVACAPVETAIVAEPGQTFALPLGKTAVVKGTDVRLTFKDVRTDSRCPIDVQCIWAGEAKIGVVISGNGTSEETKVMGLPPGDSETRAGNLRIRFVGLAPVPRQAAAGTPRAYVANLVLDQP